MFFLDFCSSFALHILLYKENQDLNSLSPLYMCLCVVVVACVVSTLYVCVVVVACVC